MLKKNLVGDKGILMNQAGRQLMTPIRQQMDFVGAILVRSGLSPRIHCANELSVYSITEENEFDGIFEPIVVCLGYINFGSVAAIVKVTKWTPRGVQIPPRIDLDIANPNFHIELLKCFDISDAELERYDDDGAFEF